MKIRAFLHTSDQPHNKEQRMFSTKQNTKCFPPQRLKVESLKQPFLRISYTATCKNIRKAPCSPPVSILGPPVRITTVNRSHVNQAAIFPKSKIKKPERPCKICHQVPKSQKSSIWKCCCLTTGEEEDGKLNSCENEAIVLSTSCMPLNVLRMHIAW